MFTASVFILTLKKKQLAVPHQWMTTYHTACNRALLSVNKEETTDLHNSTDEFNAFCLVKEDRLKRVHLTFRSGTRQKLPWKGLAGWLTAVEQHGGFGGDGTVSCHDWGGEHVILRVGQIANAMRRISTARNDFDTCNLKNLTRLWGNPKWNTKGCKTSTCITEE